jgi:hypothetical protein
MVERLAEMVEETRAGQKRRRGLASRRGPGIRLSIGFLRLLVQAVWSSCISDDRLIVHRVAVAGERPLEVASFSRDGSAILVFSARMSASRR